MNDGKKFIEPAYRALEAIALAAAKKGDGTFALRAISQIADAPVRASALAAVAVSLAAGE